jgi:hypothetical protein
LPSLPQRALGKEHNLQLEICPDCN